MYRKSLPFKSSRITSSIGAILLTLSLLLSFCPPNAVRAADSNQQSRTPSASELWSGNRANSFASGSGSRYDPYLIETPEELAYLAACVNSGDDFSGKYVRLSEDLYLNDLTGYSDWQNNPPVNEWTPIGGYIALSIKNENDYSEALETHSTLYLSTEDDYIPADQYIENAIFYHFAAFNGYFDGDGHSIYGLYLSAERSCAGLFGACKDATLADLTLSNAYISGKDEVGGLIGRLDCEGDALLQNCSVTADIYAEGRQVGYMAGAFNARSEHSSLTIENCSADGRLTADEMAGGMIGEAQYSDRAGNIQFENCRNSARISARTWAGGMVGRLAMPASLIGCSNTGALSADANAGGIVGEIYADVGCITVSECQNSAAMVAQNTAGGIVGLCTVKPHEDDASALEEASGDVLVELLGSSNLGNLFGAQSAGGIVGSCTAFDGAKINLSGCKNSASVNGKSQVGGIVGFLSAGGGQLSLGNSENHGAVTADTLVGGILGNACSTGDLDIYQCFSHAAVTALGDYAGGIAGSIAVSDNGNLLLELSCTNGSVKADRYAGGIVGNQVAEHASAEAVITDCFSNAQLTAVENAGGIAGAMEASSGNLVISHSLFYGGFASGNKLTGGIAAYAHARNKDASVQLIECYYHQSAASRPALLYGGNGQEVCRSASGLDNDALRGSADLIGLDFNTVWLTGNEENRYPTLRDVPFVWDNFLYTVTGQSATLVAYQGRSDIVTVPAKLGGVSVTTIDGSAFEGSDVVEVILPDSITTIGESAFANCASLRSITLSSALRAVGAGAFKNCDALETRRSATALTELYTGSDNEPFYTLPITQPLSMQAEFVYENGITAAPSSSFTCYEGDYYLIDAPAITGYEADVKTLAGICTNAEIIRVVYALGSYQLTVRYLYPDGSEAAPDYAAIFRFGESYSVISPEVSGYLPANTVLEGQMEGKNMLLTVYYSEQVVNTEPESSANRSLFIILLICSSFALICCIGYFIFRYRSNRPKETDDSDFDSLFTRRF